MSNFLIVSQLYSGIIDKVKKDNIENLNYDSLFDQTINFSRGQEFSFYYYLKKYFKVDLVYFNFNYLQYLWLKKQRAKKTTDKYQILDFQIEYYKPEIIYFQNIYYFDNNYFNSLKKDFHL